MTDDASRIGRRVLVTGMAGSGKSTFSSSLAAKTGLPVIHLDLHFWKPGWVAPPEREWREKQRHLLVGDEWIADGNYHETLDLRLERADTVVFLDTPWWVCAGRSLLRGLRKPIGEMPEGCDDSPWRRFREEWRLAAVIWRSRRSEPEREHEIISQSGQHAVLHVFGSKRAAKEFLDGVVVDLHRKPMTADGRRGSPNPVPGTHPNPRASESAVLEEDRREYRERVTARPFVLETFYSGWANHQDHLLAALRDLQPQQLALRPAPHEWAIWQIASHMAGSRAFWFHDVLGEGDDGVWDMFRVQSTTVPELPLADAGWEDDENHPRSASDIFDAFQRTWAVIDECLRKWTLDDLEVGFSRSGYDGMTTRAWVIWHLIEHEGHHGGAISLILGSNGLPGLDI